MIDMVIVVLGCRINFIRTLCLFSLLWIKNCATHNHIFGDYGLGDIACFIRTLMLSFMFKSVSMSN